MPLVGRGIGRVGRPGLIGTMARTAVIAGTATAVAGGVANHQQAKAAEKAQAQAAQDQVAQQQAYDQQMAMAQQAAAQVAAQQAQAQPAPAAAAPAEDMDDKIAQLQKLADLKSAGILTDEEFAAQKAKILGA